LSLLQSSAERLNPSAVTKLSLEFTQNGTKTANSKKLKAMLINGWQKGLVEFSVS
jgi:hypothetical protein